MTMENINVKQLSYIFVFMDIQNKLKPNKDTLGYNEKVRLPYVLRSILSEETLEKLKELCPAQFAQQLRDNKIEIV